MTYKIFIKGLVQGVGFRPFIYKLAIKNNLVGYVDNNTQGVEVVIRCSKAYLERFINLIKSNKPQVAVISDITFTQINDNLEFEGFKILPSKFIDGQITRVSADIATCKDCLEDFKNQKLRINYPLINCTNCGPRFSIVKKIPYDRCNTTMNNFTMCPNCKHEYNNPLDRRFHAQPISCNLCGPKFRGFFSNAVKEDATNYTSILNNTINVLKNGGVVAMKGLGGYVWIVDALNQNAVKKLRDIKRRYVKPFAIMCNGLDWIGEYVYVSDIEKDALESWRRPIVVLKERKKVQRYINDKLDTLGVMFPYLPFHYSLFEQGGFKALVVTSANAPNEPMVIDNNLAYGYVLENCQYFVENNRDIFNRVDDSVVRVICGKEQIFRRSRGYVPEPLVDIYNVEGGIAFGAHITSAFAIGRSKQILLSQYIGELEDLDAQKSFNECLSNFKDMFLFKPTFVVCDMHPNYYSTEVANNYASDNNLPIYKVQHHHAHIVSVMAEYGLEGKVLGVALDGTGLGSDGMSWGGEVFLCDRGEFERLDHLPYVPLLGGDKAAKECWRMAVSFIESVYKEDSLNILSSLGLMSRVEEEKIVGVLSLINSPLQKNFTSSVGRLFDAISSLLGLCDFNSFQGEGAVLLESMGQKFLDNLSEIPHNLIKEKSFSYYKNSSLTFNINPIIIGVVEDLLSGIDTHEVAFKFHSSLGDVITSIVIEYLNKLDINRVVLGGGCFQNKILTEIIIGNLENKGVEVFYPRLFPCNDGGLAVGQLAAVAFLRSKN